MKFAAEPPVRDAPKLSGLDDSVVQAALSAGVPESHLREMSELLRRNPHRMGDLPSRGQGRERNDLSDSEDEEAEVEEGITRASSQPSSPSSDGGIAKAIVKLTKLCNVMAENQMQKKQNKFENLLDSTAASSDGSGLGGPRRNAAALRLLRDNLIKDPEMIYKSIESNLASDFLSRPASPETPLSGATARGWLKQTFEGSLPLLFFSV